MHNRPSTSNLQRRRAGFTLTELLVVIAIIGMLVAITSVAVVRALDTAKQTRMKTEIDQLDAAFKSYKEKYGSYPPFDWVGLGSSNAQLRQHIAQAFPRYNMGSPSGTPAYKNLNDDLIAAGIDTGNRRPDQALVFWLSGFSNDPLHPFVSPDGFIIENGAISLRPANRTPFYEFDQSRLMGVRRRADDTPEAVPDWKVRDQSIPAGGMTGTVPSYFPQGITPGLSGAPFVYFDAGKYGTGTTYGPPVANPPKPLFGGFNTSSSKPPLYADAGGAVPYYLDANGDGTANFDASGNPIENWVNPESFQIIAPGGDGKYGATGAPGKLFRLYPTGLNYDVSSNLADDDNVTNFCNQSRLATAKP